MTAGSLNLSTTMNGAYVICHCVFLNFFFFLYYFFSFLDLSASLCLTYLSLLDWEPQGHLGASVESLYWSLKEFSTTPRGRKKVLGPFLTGGCNCFVLRHTRVLLCFSILWCWGIIQRGCHLCQVPVPCDRGCTAEQECLRVWSLHQWLSK